MSTIPLLFMLAGTARHELILLDTSTKPSLKALNKQVSTTMAASPNCAEFMSKYKSNEGPTEQIQEFRMRWNPSEHDAKVWPESTVVTEENLEAIVEMLKLSPRSGVLEIKVGKPE